jgi:P-type Cu2+ transporter
VGPAHHGGHADHAAMFRSRFWVSLVLSVPVILYGHIVQTRPGFSMPGFPGSRLAPPVLGTFALHRDGRS